MHLLDILLNIKMEVPTLFGSFHLLCLLITVLLIVVIYKYKDNINERLVYGIYGFGSLLLEIIKQYMYNFDFINGKLVFSYGWDNFPFQLSDTPMYVAIILFFIKDGKLKDHLINYLSYYILVSSLAVCVYPSLVLSEYTLVNIETMYLHCGSLILSLYLIFTNKVDKSMKGLFKAFKVFIVFVCLAVALDVGVYNLHLNGNDEFNMFFISPYYINPIPGVAYLQTHLPYPIYLLIYIAVLTFGAFLVNRIISIKKDN